MRKLALAGLATIGIATSALAIEPGNWESTSRMVDIEVPADMPPQVADMMRQMLGGEGMTNRSCVTQEDLDNAPERLFAESDGECEYTEFDMSAGTMRGVARCNSDAGTMTMTMDGTYADTTYEGTMRMQGDMGMGPTTMVFDVAGTRLGDC
ncbi:DUF3617 domain-containing protein [Aurantiacibacter poecillastricola]|uniref:DUF3617 domain-containing protein n=1 Tax=Aurantiacibacter poecillastricola TaxID=3064385 RepID=UPI00273FFF54|nr:DUF3617 domain-containing protein [Aurantiacibacter sp. 219JJ12-13]MDP5261502.1 DUF3617 domain-containing protein [Aurantiacibacter sp. 219JJ12-13]